MPLSGARPAFFGSVALFLGDRSNGRWQVDVGTACEYLDRVREYQQATATDQVPGLPDPTGLYIAGASPFGQLDDLETLLDRATRHRMMAEVVTTASWVDSEDTAKTVLERFSKKLHLLTIFTSRGEIDRYGMSALEQLLLAARHFNMSIQIHVGVGPGEPFPKELLALEVLNCDTSVLRVEPVGGQPGNGTEWPPGYLLEAPPRYARCAELMGFVMTPAGDVYPCASGVGFAQLRLGSLDTDSVAEIVRRAMAKADLGRLRKEGPFHLYEPWRDSHPAGELSRGFLSSCDFHRQVLAAEKVTA